jgi:hypothetical protein
MMFLNMLHRAGYEKVDRAIFETRRCYSVQRIGQYHYGTIEPRSYDNIFLVTLSQGIGFTGSGCQYIFNTRQELVDHAAI